MEVTGPPPHILVAEDDEEEDYLVVLESFKESGLFGGFARVKDGEQLLDYLYKRGPYADAQRPDIILLDLNMPRKDGREALREIRSDSGLRDIPIAVLTSSSADEDVVRAYGLGVEYFVRKPVEFQQVLDIIRAIDDSRRAREEAHARRIPAV